MMEETATLLLELENKAWEASKNHDVNFYVGYLADDVIAISPIGVRDRLAVLNDLVINRTEMKDIGEVTIQDPKVIMLGPESGLITYKADLETEHGGMLGSISILATSVYVKRNDSWKLLLHQQTPVY